MRRDGVQELGAGLDLAGEEVEEAVQLVRVASQGRRERHGIGTRRGLEASHLELQAVAEPLYAAEHAHRVAFGEAPVEQLHVVPHACLDTSTRVHELEREVRRAAARAQLPLACDRVDPLDDPFFRQLGDRVHPGRLTGVADVRPFRALRYDEAKAGPLERLVAPPYDVISEEERTLLLALSPYNVVHLTLPDSEEQAGRDLCDWRDAGVLVR